ncbi:MAG: hypothetical protein ACREN6_00700 [Gemmatimonadaceae bacterium]
MRSMNAGSRVLLVLFALAACDGHGATAPTSSSQTATPPVTPPTASGPALTGPERTFLLARDLLFPTVYDPPSDAVQVVLYDSGAFQLTAPLVGVSYEGSYIGTNGSIVFKASATAFGGPWDATGALSANGDSLTIHFDLLMQSAGWDDAVFALRP